jgi:hypothetical protein
MVKEFDLRSSEQQLALLCHLHNLLDLLFDDNQSLTVQGSVFGKPGELSLGSKKATQPKDSEKSNSHGKSTKSNKNTSNKGSTPPGSVSSNTSLLVSQTLAGTTYDVSFVSPLAEPFLAFGDSAPYEGNVFRVSLRASPFSVVAKLGSTSVIDEEYSLLRVATQEGSARFCVPLQAPLRVSNDRALLLLSDCGDPRAPTSEKELLTFARDLLDAVETLRNVGIVHRDVKPSNVTICEGRAALVDFDIAKRLAAPKTTPATTPIRMGGSHVPFMTLPHVDTPSSSPSTPSTPATTSTTSTTLSSPSTPDLPESVQPPVAGTIGFIAPELESGEPATTLSDMFAVGKTIQHWAEVLQSSALAFLVENLTQTDPLKRMAASKALETMEKDQGL